jgi:hypothetical protein
LPPATPLTSHVTELLVAPEIVALNCSVAPTYNCARVGVIVIATILVVVLPDLLGSPLATALIDTGLSAGGCAGAQ